ncbi:MAG TPA: ADP-ribosylglycohydrolase family protein [Armatimonadota bacterium]|jgi:ADP-ribosyl-[dinitrogen reductase] hydrolase
MNASRFRGTLLGLACGDALGAPAQHLSGEEVRRTWGILQDMVGTDRAAAGEWSSRSITVFAAVQGILSDPYDPVRGIGTRLLRVAEGRADLDKTTRAALRGYHGDWPRAAKATPLALGGQGTGSGSLGRVVAVSLAYGETERMLSSAARVSAITHWDTAVESCCGALALCLHSALRGRDARQALRTASARARAWASSRNPSEDTPGCQPLRQSLWLPLSRLADISYRDLLPSGAAASASDCLLSALWCWLHGDNAEETIVLAANLGGDAATVASLAGALAGATYGAESLPERWLSVLMHRRELERAAEQLFALRCFLNPVQQAAESA